MKMICALFNKHNMHIQDINFTCFSHLDTELKYAASDIERRVNIKI